VRKACPISHVRRISANHTATNCHQVSVAFEGAVGTGGVSRISQPARCSAVGNGTDALSAGSGTVNFVCAFNSTPDAVAASPLKFRANTAAAGAWAGACGLESALLAEEQAATTA
jgi:hypothetical protein